MKAVDRWLQSWRIAKARPYIARGSRVLDVGCADGALFRQLPDRVGEGVGIDPDLEKLVKGPGYRLIPGQFPQAILGEPPFDVITMLAVLEHVPPDEQQKMARACAEVLKPGGHLVITTPSPWVDHILHVLAAIRVIDGMSLDEHYGFEPGDTPGIFERHGLTLMTAKRFQMGLNHLFVFRMGNQEENATAARSKDAKPDLIHFASLRRRVSLLSLCPTRKTHALAP